MLALIDGDSLIYRCAFAAQHRIYEFEGNDYNSKKELDSYIKTLIHKEDAPFLPYTSRIEVEPVENALSNVKQVLQRILKITPISDYALFISSDASTFRHTLATIKPYKGNRDQEKPIHYTAVRSYLIQQWDAHQVYGVEVDDVCGFRQYEAFDEEAEDGYDQWRTSCIVSNDKDLQQIPGFHINWTHESPVFNFIDPEIALYNKYIQIISGDATDNIEGIPGMGDAKASKLLQSIYGSSEAEYDEFCSSYYKSVLESDTEIKMGHMKGMTMVQYLNLLSKSAEEVYNETKALITILTKRPTSEDFEII